jgi:phosphoesterase RecJ-like protein
MMKMIMPMPANSDAVVSEVGERLRRAEKILVVSHIRPDGDAVGSLLGLGLALQQAGKTVQMALSDGVPHSFRHLEGSKQVVKKPAGPFDLVAVVDCSDLERVGNAMNGVVKPGVNIDHHITNVNFAEVNLVWPTAVSTSAVLAENLPGWGYELTQPVASALLTGLVSDTLGFRTSNMTSAALRLAADLMDRGADLPELYMRALVNRSYTAARYWGAGLGRIRIEGRLVYTSLTLEDRELVSYSGNDDADLINILSSIDEADIAVIFVEQRGKKVKVSWRAVPGIDVSQLAFRFGGGGHPAASGAEISGSLEEVQAAVLPATAALIENNS